MRAYLIANSSPKTEKLTFRLLYLAQMKVYYNYDYKCTVIHHTVYIQASGSTPTLLMLTLTGLLFSCNMLWDY